MSKNLCLGSGWLPDLPDPRDWTINDERIRQQLERAKALRILRSRRKLPARVDLRPHCPPVRFQGGFNSCSAHVVAALLEYFEKRILGTPTSVSRLFLYKVTKNFLQETGNVAVFIRQTMGCLRLVGVPPEKYWPYPDPGTLARPRRTDRRLDDDPPAFCYALAQAYRDISYYRLDSAEKPCSGEQLLKQIKRHLAIGIPIAFGFAVFGSKSTADGHIPMPTAQDERLSSHAVLAVGYDDHLQIVNGGKDGQRSTGALLFQNSWSTGWGDAGYGWLPYDFVRESLARDFWTLLHANWIDAGGFQLDL